MHVRFLGTCLLPVTYDCLLLYSYSCSLRVRIRTFICYASLYTGVTRDASCDRGVRRQSKYAQVTGLTDPRSLLGRNATSHHDCRGRCSYWRSGDEITLVGGDTYLEFLDMESHVWSTWPLTRFATLPHSSSTTLIAGSAAAPL